MFTNYMPFNSNTRAFLAWKECVRRNKQLREKLSLPEDNKEDYRMCQGHYKAFVKENLTSTRKELGIKGPKDATI